MNVNTGMWWILRKWNLSSNLLTALLSLVHWGFNLKTLRSMVIKVVTSMNINLVHQDDVCHIYWVWRNEDEKVMYNYILEGSTYPSDRHAGACKIVSWANGFKFMFKFSCCIMPGLMYRHAPGFVFVVNLLLSIILLSMAWRDICKLIT